MADVQVQKWQTKLDGLENLFRATSAMPKPGKGEVLVKISAVSLNYRDTEVIMGLYNHHKTVNSGDIDPLVPCSDMCGTVVAIGDDNDNDALLWAVGDRVLSTFNQAHLTGQIKAPIMASGLGLPLEGVLQTHRVFPATGLVRAPSHMSDEEAACLPIAAVTAWMAINQFRPLGAPGGRGETVLLQGTGGVSVSGLQIAKAAGATSMFFWSRLSALFFSPCDPLKQLHRVSADSPSHHHVLLGRQARKGQGPRRRPRHQLPHDARLAGPGHGADGRGGRRRDPRDGRRADAAQVDEAGDRTNVNLLALARNVTLKGILNGPRDRFEEMVRFYEAHAIRPVVDRVFGFAEGREALQYLFSGSHFGKVVVKVDV
ncbi:hypothetical protein VDGD_02097 [Verticillium dahliae]|nr:hypothetical protein VDGD_02097 [Verticillium dahliae]